MEPVLDYNGYDISGDELITGMVVVGYTRGRDYFFLNNSVHDKKTPGILCYLDRARNVTRVPCSGDIVFTAEPINGASVPPIGTKVVCLAYWREGGMKASAWIPKSEYFSARSAA